jgi:hypothetical protein
MDTEDWLFAACMAVEEKRRSEKKAREEKERLKAQYDQWCIEHGCPPPPDYQCRERQYKQAKGSSGAGWLIAGFVIFVLLVLFFR